MVMAVMSDGTCQILKIRQLTGSRGVRKIVCKLVQLSCARGVAAGLCGLRRALQISGYFLRDLRILRGIRLLKLLEGIRDLCEGRKLSAIGLLNG